MSADEYVQHVLDRAPELSDEKRATLTRIFQQRRHDAAQRMEPLEHSGKRDPLEPDPAPPVGNTTARHLLGLGLGAHLPTDVKREAWRAADTDEERRLIEQQAVNR